MKRLFTNKNFIAGFILVVFLLVICAVSYIYTPYPPNQMYSDFRFQKPGGQFLFGTDNFGRDILSRIMAGSQTAFYVGTLSVLISMFFGVSLGSIAGYYGGIFDTVFSRLIDIIMTFPTVLFALMLIVVLGGGIQNTIIVLGISSVPRFARLARSSFMQHKNMEYIKAAKMKGASDFRIMFIHILPNIRSSLIVNASFSFSMSVMTEAGLSYLGLGIQPPDASWGRMLNEAQPYLGQAPWYVGFTGAMIVIMVLGFNLLGDGINETYNK